MKNLKYSFLAILCLLLLANLAEAQRFTKKKHYWSFGATLSAANYFGDLAPLSSTGSFDFGFTRPQLGPTIEYKFHPRVSARASLSWIRIQGDDRASASGEISDPNVYRHIRNLSFRNDMVELAAVVKIDFFENRGVFYKRPRHPVPYALIGLAAVYHNPQAEYNGSWYDLYDYKTEGDNNGRAYSNIAFAIPLGLGIKYGLTARWDVGFEVAFRYTFTDELDDVSTYYPEDLAERDGLAYELSTRAHQTGSKALSTEVDAIHGSVTLSTNGKTMKPGYGYDSVELNSDGSLKSVGPPSVRGKNGNDHYMVYGFTASYVLGGGIKCPKFR